MSGAGIALTSRFSSHASTSSCRNRMSRPILWTAISPRLTILRTVQELRLSCSATRSTVRRLWLLMAGLQVAKSQLSGASRRSSVDMTSSLNTSSFKTLTIRNLGHASLTIESLPLPEDLGGGFHISQQPSSPLAPGNSTTLIVEFHPTSTGNKSATLSIPSDDPDVSEDPYVITLSGYCEPQMSVLEVLQGGLSDFGTVFIGESTDATFTVKNSGSADLVLYGPPVSISGGGEANFSILQQPASRVVASGTSAFVIRFAPNSQGLKSATVSIMTNDPDKSPYSFTIQGTGERMGPQIPTEETELILTSPLGGEEWQAGSIENVTWTGGKDIKAVKIEYSPDNGSTFLPIAERVANIGVYPWKVPADLSPVCLIRISDADGALAAPVIISYEFNFKAHAFFPGPNSTTDQKAAHFTFTAGIPDKEGQVYRVADVAFVAGEIKGSENLLFNQALVEIPTSDAFLDIWHHVRVEYDMRKYSGSVWIDSLPVITDAQLQATDLNIKSTSEISLRSGTDISVNLWIDDVEVKFLDLTDDLQQLEGGPLRRILKDNFNRYESPQLLANGGWDATIDGADTAATASNIGQAGQRNAPQRRSSSKSGKARSRILLDDRQFTSTPKAARLEYQAGDPVQNMTKQVSFQVRLPFAINEETFSIVSGSVGNGSSRTYRVGRELKGGADSGKENEVPSGPLSLRRRGIEVRAGVQKSQRPNSEASQPVGGGTVKKMSVSPAGGSYYIYSFDGRLLAEYNLLGACVRDYIYMGTQLVAEFRPSTSQYYYYTSDQINSTRVVTNDSGSVVYAAAHEAYGGVQMTWPSTFDPTLKFSGKERDGESELDYFGARYYDRAQYRFISTDPAIDVAECYQNPQAWNHYSYCMNSPVSFIDPNGECGRRVHYTLTFNWAYKVFRNSKIADAIASADQMADDKLALVNLQHFPSYNDVRMMFEAAFSKGDFTTLGLALHGLQDYMAHTLNGLNGTNHWIFSIAGWTFDVRLDPDNDKAHPDLVEQIEKITLRILWLFKAIWGLSNYANDTSILIPRR